MGYLSRSVIKACLLAVSEDADTTVAVDINGYEIIGVITPDTLDGGTNDIDLIEIDPGNGKFYAPLGEDGAAIDIQMDDIGTDEYLTLPALTVMRQKLVGARARLELSEDEDADRTFYLVLVALPESSD